jgi:8-oxo-dGTP pyrophosphatase MutT (NUDIX family)
MSGIERFKVISGVHLLIEKGGRILLLRRFNTGYEDGKYTTIAGHLDGKESVVSASIREAKEEAGITIKPEDLDVVYIMHRLSNANREGYSEFVLFFLVVKRWAGEPTLIERNKCDDIGWFDLNNLPENIVPYIKEGIINYGKGMMFSEFTDPY